MKKFYDSAAYYIGGKMEEVEVEVKVDRENVDITKVWYEIPTLCRYIVDDCCYARGILFHEYLIDLSTGRACTS